RVAIDVQLRASEPLLRRRAPSKATPRNQIVQTTGHLVELVAEVHIVADVDIVEPGAVLAVLPLELAVVARTTRRSVQCEHAMRAKKLEHARRPMCGRTIEALHERRPIHFVVELE